ncbi:MAG: questin oxidase family protein [Candidatus Izimaplasma sp.]|nr:questin oxidase family protein [Candidatus Izimaplasma bacterium]
MKLLKAYEAYSPIYRGGLTNHLPMMVIALYELGIDEEQIEEIANTYIDKTHIYELSDKKIPKTRFENKFVERTNFYLSEFKTQGKEPIIKRVLNKYNYGVCSALFHGVIRLHYAIISKDDLQIAQALAYHELSYDHYELSGRYVDKDVLKYELKKLQRQVKMKEIKISTNSSMVRFEQLKDTPIVKNNLFYPSRIEDSKKEILEFLLTRYLETEDFYNLHLITSFEALEALQDYYEDYETILKQFFMQAIVFLLFNLNDYDYDVEVELDWDGIISEVANLKTAHEIKLIFTLHNLSKKYKTKRLLEVANLIVI